MATFLTLLACVIFLGAFVLYNRDLFLGRSEPSIASWAMFCAITLVASSSYGVMRKDLLTAAVSITDFIVCGVTFAFLLAKGSPWNVLPIERFAIRVCIASLAAWVIFGSAASGNLLVQVAAIAAFVPTIRNAADGKESGVPWLLWTGAYLIQIIVVALRWHGDGRDLVGPINAVTLHCIVTVIALRRSRTSVRFA